jgi:hypothetical protein
VCKGVWESWTRHHVMPAGHHPNPMTRNSEQISFEQN